MTGHVCSWLPITGSTGRYSCSCGASAYRAANGEIQRQRQPFEAAPEVTVYNRDPEGLDYYGRVKRIGGTS